MDTRGFNDFHMSAFFTRLVFFNKRRKLSNLDVKNPTLWPRLATKLRSMLRKDLISPRAAANIFWALVDVYQGIGTPFAVALAPLVDCVRVKASSMNAFDLSNSIWAAAKLHASEPEVLKAVPALAENVPREASQYVPQALSNVLWAAANLQEAAPAVLSAVPSVAKRIPPKAESMIPQHLSNCLWSAAKLHESEPSVLKAVPSLAKHVPKKVQNMEEQALSNCLWAAANLHESEPGGPRSCAITSQACTAEGGEHGSSGGVELSVGCCQSARIRAEGPASGAIPGQSCAAGSWQHDSTRAYAVLLGHGQTSAFGPGCVELQARRGVRDFSEGISHGRKRDEDMCVGSRRVGRVRLGSSVAGKSFPA